MFKCFKFIDDMMKQLNEADEMPMEDDAEMGGDDAAMEDPAAEGDMGMEGGEAEGGDDSTASIIDQLSDDDKEAVRNYAKSLLNRDETSAPEEPAMEEPAPTPSQGQDVMMEISKGRLKKVQKVLREKFRDVDDKEDKTDRKQKKVNKDFRKKTPFDSPVK